MDFIQGLQNYWILIVFVGGVIASWARYEIKLNNLEGRVNANHQDNVKEIEKIQVQQASQASSLDIFRETIGKNIQEIQTTMKFILEAVNEVKKK